jgi:hypothetical protein
MGHALGIRPGIRRNTLKITTLICAGLMAALLPSVALADDPNDPSMRSAAARARDHELTRQLNLRQSAMVRERDARYAQTWQAQGSYTQARAQYERDMETWRHDVAACRAGDYSACAH